MQELTSFSFRGDRKYVHGTTMLEAFRKHDPNPATFDVQFKKTTDRQCLLKTEIDPDRKAGLVATYVSKGLSAFLYETDVPVRDSYLCNEREITPRVLVDGQEARCHIPAVPASTPSQCVVAMYKHLLQMIFSDYPKKYFWARLTADCLPMSGACAVRHHRRIGSDFFEGRLLHEGQTLGAIFFGAR